MERKKRVRERVMGCWEVDAKGDADEEEAGE
jgi:hypothetical protein